MIGTIDWITRAGTVLMLVGLLWLVDDTSERSHCQARVDQGQAQRAKNLEDELRAERQTERRADDAMAALVNSLLARPDPDTKIIALRFAALQTALVDQQKARTAADNARAANPPQPGAEQEC